jgi:hypothetical protein
VKKARTANKRFATMLARRNNNKHLGTISYYPADGILSTFVVNFNFINFNQLQLSARHYKMPAQQQAVDVVRHPIEHPTHIQASMTFADTDPTHQVRHIARHTNPIHKSQPCKEPALC